MRPARRGRNAIRSGSRDHNYAERDSSDSEDAGVSSFKLDSPIWSAVSDKLAELTDTFATRAKVRRGPYSLGSLQTKTGKKDFKNKFKAVLHLMLDTLSGGDEGVKAAMLPLVLSSLGVGTGKRKSKRKARINPNQMLVAFGCIQEFSRGFSWEVKKNHFLGEKTTFLHRNISLTDMYALLISRRLPPLQYCFQSFKHHHSSYGTGTVHLASYSSANSCRRTVYCTAVQQGGGVQYRNSSYCR
jgi:hypothetical protein